MKKFIFLVLFLAGWIAGRAQTVPEPEFIGGATIIDLKSNQFRNLPKERGILRVADFMGVRTKKIIMKEKGSPLEIPNNANYGVIIKAETNLYDPMSMFQVFKFETNLNDERVVELSRTSTGTYYSEGNANNKMYIEFSAKKYGESSYILTFPVTPGCYGIITGNIDEEFLIIATFDVYDLEKRKEEEERLREIQEAMLAKKQKKEERKKARVSVTNN